MRICQPHWSDLQKAIDDRMLGHLVANSGEEAIRRVAGQLDEQPQTGTFDPLLNANFAIWGNALKAGGLYLMSNDEAGNPYCPLCELEKHAGTSASEWITLAADEQLEQARQLELVPPPQ